MNEIVNPLFSSNLPLFNQIAFVAINFVAVSLMVMVMIESKLKDKKSILFMLMGIFMLTWVDFAYLARITGEQNLMLAEVFLRIAWIATPLLFYVTYLTSGNIISDNKKYTLQDLLLLILALGLSFTTAFSKLVIETIAFSENSLDIIYGSAFIPFLFCILVFMVLTLQPIIRHKLTSGSKFFLFGVLIFYIFNSIFNIGLPFFLGITHLYYFGDYSTIFLLSFTLYAIFRHNLLDVKVFTTELLTIALWSVLLARILVFKTIQGLVIDLVVLFVSFIFGYFLIQSVKREIEQKELLSNVSKRLKELDAQKDEFLNVAAHELRAPMTAIKGYLSMISDGDGGKVSKKLAEFVGEAELENDRLIRLVNNLLNISRIEEGRMVFELGKVDLSKVVETNFKNFEGQAKEKNLKYSLEIEKGVHDKVEVDVDRIHEVVANLLSNAIKYTDSGFVKASLKNRENHVRFEVEDSGAGLSEHEQQKLFQKFYRAESSINKQIGTGLGLYISKLLVEHFNGQIGMSSEIGKGSTFWFELPHKK